MTRSFDPESTRPAVLFSQESGPSVCEPPSLLGAVSHGSDGENWPTLNGERLQPLLQLNLAGVPLRPKGVEGVDFLTVFGDLDSGIFVRTYSSLSSLRCLEQGPLGEKLAAPLLIEDNRQAPTEGIKLGGWCEGVLQVDLPSGKRVILSREGRKGPWSVRDGNKPESRTEDS